MKKSKTIIFFLMIIIFSVSVFADEYTQIGSSTNDFTSENGNFLNNNSLIYVSGGTFIDNKATYPPLVADLDNDGINEIIVYDGGNVILYSPPSLSVVDTYSLGVTTNGMVDDANPIIYDINGDGFLDVIIYQGSTTKKLYVISYNGSDMILNNSFQITGGDTDAEYSLGCMATNDCLLFFTKDRRGEISQTEYLYAKGFNSSAITTTTKTIRSVVNTASTNAEKLFCLSKWKNVPVANPTGSGNRYVLVSAKIGENIDEIVYIDFVYNNGSEIIVDDSLGFSTTFYSGGSGSSDTHCDDENLGIFFSNAITSDFDPSKAGLETVIGIADTDDDFRIYVFDSTLTEINQHPQVQQGQGTMLSNIMKANAFPDGDLLREDYCVLGKEKDVDSLELVCGSMVNTDNVLGVPVETIDFDYDITGMESYIVSNSYGWNTFLIHSGQYISTQYDNSNIDEFITPYGVFSLDFVFTDELIWEYTIPKPDSCIVPIDATNKGSTDFLMIQNISLTQNYLWYLNDGYTNQPAEIDMDSIIIDPSWEYQWLQNTTVKILFSATDPEGDNVFTRAYLYYDDVDEQQQNSSVYIGSGLPNIFWFDANTSTSNAELRLQAWDINNPSQIDTISYFFKVGKTGISYGDGYVFQGEKVSETEDTAELSDEDKLAVKNAILGNGLIDNAYGSLLGFILIIIGVVVTAMIMSKYGVSGNPVLFISLFVGFALWIIFAMISLVPAWTIIIGLLFSSLGIGLTSYNKLSGVQ